MTITNRFPVIKKLKKLDNSRLFDYTISTCFYDSISEFVINVKYNSDTFEIIKFNENGMYYDDEILQTKIDYDYLFPFDEFKLLTDYQIIYRVLTILLNVKFI